MRFILPSLYKTAFKEYRRTEAYWNYFYKRICGRCAWPESVQYCRHVVILDKKKKKVIYLLKFYSNFWKLLIFCKLYVKDDPSRESPRLPVFKLKLYSLCINKSTRVSIIFR